VRTFGYSLAMSLAQLPGYLTAAYLVERIGRRPSLLAFFAGSAAAAVPFALAPSTDSSMKVTAFLTLPLFARR
jgi:putative MFS transporter